MMSTTLHYVNNNHEIIFIDGLSTTFWMDVMSTSDMDLNPLVLRDLDADRHEYVVVKILGHDVINVKTLYHLSRYGYGARADTAKLQDHLSKDFITAFWNMQNRQARPAHR